MTPRERIECLQDLYGLNTKALADKLGYDRPQVLYDIIKGKTAAISAKMANKIISVFPDVNKAWLLTGEGDPVQNCEYESRANSPIVHITPERDYTGELAALQKEVEILREQVKELQNDKSRLLDILEQMTIR